MATTALTGRRRRPLALSLAAALLALAAVGVLPTAAATPTTAQSALRGHVRSGELPLPGFRVALWAAPSAPAPVPPVEVGSAVTDAAGSFRVGLPATTAPGTLFYLTATRGPDVELAAVLGSTPGREVVVNEATTVAAGFALAQFVDQGAVSGAAPGPLNAAAMAANLADSRTGGASTVLSTPPNGDLTSTMRTFNSLANTVATCVRDTAACGALLALAARPGGPAPTNSFDAVAQIARHPARNAAAVFALASRAPAIYQPSLGPGRAPDAWTLALRFDGDGSSLNGPGNFAIDAQGNVWTTANYTYSRNPLAPVCGGKQLFKFTPGGKYAPGSPYSGGGVDGAGFGITLDPTGHVWLGNFGFAAVNCASPPQHNSVSEFTADGRPISPSASSTSTGGFTQGQVDWPQGVVSDAARNIYIANCGNDSVTRYPNGDPTSAANTPATVQEPFDLALNGRGQLFVTGNRSNTVAVLDTDGTPAGPPITGGGIDHPLGIAADTEGNMWVANSGAVTIPCPSGGISPSPTGGSITLITDAAHAPVRFTGGGLTVPWGIAVDGADHVWVANFAGQRLSEFCGTATASCPPGVTTGQPISPASGYGFDGLVRNTGVAIDPSGNVWVANNWKNLPLPQANPGGYQVVAFVGAATPLKTPLIGPPRALPGAG